MAINIQTSYSTELLEHILTLTTTGNELVDRGLIRIEPGVHKEFTIPRLVVSKMLQKRKEMPASEDSKGAINLDEVKIKPKDAMLYFEFNPRSLESFWRKWQPKGNLVFSELPESVKGKFIEAVISQAQDELGEHLISGVYGEGEGQFFDGILTRIVSNNQTIRVTTSETSIIKRLRAVRKAIPMTIRRKANLRILMSQSDFDKYDEELTDLHHKGADETEINKERFKGIKLEPLVQWPDDVIVATLCGSGLDTNLWAACNLEDDSEALQIDKVANNGEKYFFKMLFKMDTNIAWGGITVLLDKRSSKSVQSIVVDPQEIVLDADGEEVECLVTATGDYTIAGTHTGFTVEKTEYGISIKAEKNTSGSDRTGTVQLTLTGTSKVAKVELFQADGK